MKSGIFRYLLIILSIEFLVLSVFPCQDKNNLEAKHQMEHNQDECSPFCVCQCCHTSVMLDLIIADFLPEKTNSDFKSIYLAFTSDLILNAHFHPPRRI